MGKDKQLIRHNASQTQHISPEDKSSVKYSETTEHGEVPKVLVTKARS